MRRTHYRYSCYWSIFLSEIFVSNVSHTKDSFEMHLSNDHVQGDHLELSQKLLMITFKEKRICQATILHIVDVFSPFDNNTPTSSNQMHHKIFIISVFFLALIFENLQIYMKK